MVLVSILMLMMKVSTASADTNVNVSVFYGNVIIPFVDRFPKNSIYKIMTTRLEETSEAG